MNDAVSIIIWLIISVVCAIIHKNKGYSQITGFLLEFFFSIMGLIVVLLENDKEENDIYKASRQGLTMGQWIAIFVGIGVILIVIFLIVFCFR